MTDEEDMARDARSVACADAPGRVFDEVTDIGFRTSYTEVSEPYDFTVDLTTRRDGKRFLGISAGDAGIEWPCELLDWLMTALTRIKEARSESEDTQPKATPTQDDVDALVRAMKALTEAYGGSGHTRPNQGRRVPHSRSAEACRRRPNRFQKG